MRVIKKERVKKRLSKKRKIESENEQKRKSESENEKTEREFAKRKEKTKVSFYARESEVKRAFFADRPMILGFLQNSTFPTSAFSFSSNSDLVLQKSVHPSVCSLFFFFFFFEARRYVCAFGGGRNFEKYKLNLGFTQT
jgi:hypothetical protein